MPGAHDRTRHAEQVNAMNGLLAWAQYSSTSVREAISTHVHSMHRAFPLLPFMPCIALCNSDQDQHYTDTIRHMNCYVMLLETGLDNPGQFVPHDATGSQSIKDGTSQGIHVRFQLGNVFACPEPGTFAQRGRRVVLGFGHMAHASQPKNPQILD